MNTGMINVLPPYYIEPSNIHTWLVEIFNSPFGLPCICGDQTEGFARQVVRPKIVSICQRESQPCKVEVKFHLGTAEGVYHYQPAISGFSLDTTDGLNGTWHQLNPDVDDLAHNTNNPGTNYVNATWSPTSNNIALDDDCNPNWSALGIPLHTFVFNMCEHVSTWLSENKISFRLSFDKIQDGVIQNISCGTTFI